jgi:uncharacterized DUF497 family protein
VYERTYTIAVPHEVPEWTWDPEKARSNRRKHGISFADAVIALEDPLALTVPDRTRGEERLVTMGQDSEGKLIVVAWIPREVGGRIVSARKATPRERRSYEEKS